jgi:polysaccharide export outer membrane protein
MSDAMKPCSDRKITYGLSVLEQLKERADRDGGGSRLARGGAGAALSTYDAFIHRIVDKWICTSGIDVRIFRRSPRQSSTFVVVSASEAVAAARAESRDAAKRGISMRGLSTVLKTSFLVAAIMFLAGCEQTFDTGPRGASTSLTSSAPEAPSEESKKLAQSVGAFVAASTPGNTAYKIGSQDVVEVVVFKVPELTRSVQVADTGTINLPLIGDVPAAGRTAQELERDISTRLGATYLKKPQVSIYVKEFNSQRVTIEGAVRRPGVYPIRGKNSLLQFVAVAEGVDRDTASGTVMVFRTSNGQRIASEFDLDAIREGRAPDPAIADGDIIIVPTSTAKVVFSSFLKMSPAIAAFRPTAW